MKMYDLDKVKKIFLEINPDASIVEAALSAKKYRKLMPRHKGIKGHVEKFIDIEKSIQLYDVYEVPMYKIAMVQGVCDEAIRKILISNGVKMRGHKCGRNSRNFYFAKIDSPDKAYFLGLIIADGSVVLAGKHWSLKISLTASDAYILEEFIKRSKVEAKLEISHPEDSKPRKAVCVNSEMLCEDLIKIGVVPNKSHEGAILPFSDIPEHLMHHFIRGIYDGDGIANQHGYIGFCGCQLLMYQLNAYLIGRLNISGTKVIYNSSNHIWYIQWGKLEDVRRLEHYMYANCENLFLTRKRNKIEKRLRLVAQ